MHSQTFNDAQMQLSIRHSGNIIHSSKHSTCSLHSLTVNTHMNIYHGQMQTSIRHSGNIIHLSRHSFNMFIIFINKIYSCRSKMDKITYLMMNSIRNQLRRCNVPPNHRPACSLISQQRCHPRAGHDSPRNKGRSRLTHSQANTVGFIRPSRSGKGSMLSWWAHYRAKNTYTRTSLTSKTPIHTQHKESVPSLLHSPSGPAFPSSAIQGWWRRRPVL